MVPGSSNTSSTPLATSSSPIPSLRYSSALPRGTLCNRFAIPERLLVYPQVIDNLCLAEDTRSPAYHPIQACKEFLPVTVWYNYRVSIAIGLCRNRDIEQSQPLNPHIGFVGDRAYPKRVLGSELALDTELVGSLERNGVPVAWGSPDPIIYLNSISGNTVNLTTLTCVRKGYHASSDGICIPTTQVLPCHSIIGVVVAGERCASGYKPRIVTLKGVVRAFAKPAHRGTILL